ncbi:hypothetical protein [Nocardioides speluncae]|uniref:hypothetical protein n=1 Tax=Nocardioides speluncae TaxID=2670337 RepID=UPI0012B1619F|nr:hypothetical protein [Nocardioides speluncae]
MEIPVVIAAPDGGALDGVGPVEVVEVLLIRGPRRRRAGVVTAASAQYREHPEVRLTDAQLDEALARCGFERAMFGGSWSKGQVKVVW